MNDVSLRILACLAAYLAGSIPNGLWIARMKGVDIRTVGSGNIGATNVFRSLGKGLGVLTFALDALKGFVPAFFFPLAVVRWGGAMDWAPLGALCGVAAIAGHTFPVWLRFKGGKGVATSAGMLLGIAPAAAGIGLAVWIALMALTRYVSVASIGAAVAVPAVAWWIYRADGLFLPLLLTGLGVLIIWLHRANIARLCAGTENKFGRKKERP